jgi:S1-C subfamily serine protease
MRNRLLTLLSLFLFSVSLISCATTNLDFQREARDTFVKIKQNVAVTVCNPDNPKECLTKTSRSTGSGAVVMRTDEGSYVLTAGHVCSFEKEMQLASEFVGSKILVEMKSVNFSLGEYVSDIISMDHTIDTCLLFARNLYTTKVAKIAPYSTTLEPGERVYNVAAPVGIFYKDVVPLLEGFFMGNRDTRAYYSVPAMGGSSGSPIFNKNNEIVGMIHSVNVYFPVVSVSPPLKELRAFIVNGIRKNERLRLGEKKDRVVEPFWKGLGLSDMSDNSL